MMNYEQLVRNLLIDNSRTLSQGIPLVIDFKSTAEKAIVVSILDQYPRYRVADATTVRLGFVAAIQVEDTIYGSRCNS